MKIKRMGKSRRARRKPASNTLSQGKEAAGPGVLPPAGGARFRLIGWRRWAGRFALLIISPLLVAGAVEVGLRLFGYGYSTDFFLKQDDGKTFTINENFARQFYSGTAATGKGHPFLMSAEKKTNVVRIFILGESAALGTPNPAFGFSRILEIMLRRQYPEKKFEVINAAMRGINSHIILPITRDCAGHQPDLFVVYMGNNEVVGLHAPGPEFSFLDRNLTLIRTVQRIKGLKLGQWFMAILEKMNRQPRPDQDMEFFRAHRVAPDDPRRAAVDDHFRANLESMCRVMSASGAKVVLATVAVNQKDFPPLASLNRAGLSPAEKATWQSAYTNGIAAEAAGASEGALQHYLAAAQVDGHFADLHFRLGRCYYSRGRFDPAREHYALARDWDALQFRADHRINGIIREVAARHQGRGITLVDAERLLAESELSDQKIPGENLFHEHVHLRFAGDYLLAQAIYPAVLTALHETLGTRADSVLPSRKECADRLAWTGWDELQVDIAMTELSTQPPFLDQLDHAQRQSEAEQKIHRRRTTFKRDDLDQALAIYRAALQRDPADWQLHHNFGMLCFMTGDFPSAAEHLAVEVRTFPNNLAGRIALGSALNRAGKEGEAMAQFKEALRLDPNNAPAKSALTMLRDKTSSRRE